MQVSVIWSVTYSSLINRFYIIIYTNWRPSCKKGVYRILADFQFLQDRANFWQTDLFWHEKHRSVIVSVDLRFVLQKWCMQKNSAFLWRPFVQRKKKKPFVSLSFISHTITIICYFCFVGASDWGAVRGQREFVLSWHRFETRSADFFFLFFLTVSLLISKTKTFI